MNKTPAEVVRELADELESLNVKQVDVGGIAIAVERATISSFAERIRALSAPQGEAVWQFQQQGYPYPWLDAENEADARHWERAGYRIRVLYTASPPQQAEQGQPAHQPGEVAVTDEMVAKFKTAHAEGMAEFERNSRPDYPGRLQDAIDAGIRAGIAALTTGGRNG